MDVYGQELLQIGELAQKSGVSIKTIRHYSDIGLLPPTSITTAQFRLYSDADRARLEVIRSLREADFSLATIKRLLDNRHSVTLVLDTQLAAIEEDLNRLKRQKLLLSAALQSSEDEALTYLAQVRSLTHLDAADRENFLDQYLQRIFQDVDADASWKESIWQEVILGHQRDLDRHQLEAWVELATIISQKSFTSRFKELTAKFWNDRSTYHDSKGWYRHEDRAVVLAAAMAGQGEKPHSTKSQVFIQKFIESSACLLNRNNDPGLPAELARLIEDGMDRNLNRFWELTGVLKGWSAGRAWSHYQGHCWLYRCLKYWIDFRSGVKQFDPIRRTGSVSG